VNEEPVELTQAIQEALAQLGLTASAEDIRGYVLSKFPSLYEKMAAGVFGITLTAERRKLKEREL